jgi:hypothetical protein
MGHELEYATRIDGDGPAHLLATKFNRHTFWCGQSGSGKTYALGVVLERVVLGTRLPVVILDPNSDFVKMDRVRAGADPALAEEWAQRDIRILPSVAEPDAPAVRVQFTDMPLRAKAAILQLDPIRDADEFNAMLRIDPSLRGRDADLLSGLRASRDDGSHRIATRIENLGVLDWELWARHRRSVTQVIDDRPDAVVVDLGGFATQAEPKAAALAVLDHLWENRADRVGRLIVIDEAHNLCTPNPQTDVEALLTERIVQIAAEGRKYGLWLLLSTQRPSKLHPNALSQCDNLALMRMNSTRDLGEIADVFSFVPEAMLAQVTGFRQGQSLFAGGFAAEPLIVQMGDRITEEGGSDVSVPLR